MVELLARSIRCRDKDKLIEAEYWYKKAESLFNLIFCIAENGNQGTITKIRDLKEHLKKQLHNHRYQLRLQKIATLAAKQEYDLALSVLDQLIIEDPDNKSSYEEYKTTLSEKRKNAHNLCLHIEKGRQYLENLDGEEALKYLSCALALAPDDLAVQKLYSEAVKLGQRQKHGWAALSPQEKIAFIRNVSLPFLLLTLAIYLLARVTAG
jgi:tetratricopeptide (TPR) repeat protein